MAPVCDLSGTAPVRVRRDLASEICYLLAVLVRRSGSPFAASWRQKSATCWLSWYARVVDGADVPGQMRLNLFEVACVVGRRGEPARRLVVPVDGRARGRELFGFVGHRIVA